jgi:inorganic phosphate transporter, PiT family
MAAAATPAPATAVHDKLSRSPGKIGMIIFGLALVAGLIYTIISLATDLQAERGTSIYPYLLLGVALLVALGFEFVNGFHDTANAVATVIYTHSMEPHLAVAWSGFCNFTGVLVSGGAVAYSIITLLPVELILQVGSGAGLSGIWAPGISGCRHRAPTPWSAPLSASASRIS